MNQEIEYRDYRIVQMSATDMAPLLGCRVEEAVERLSINGMRFHHVYVVLDEFDESPMPLPGMWFEAPLTAKAAIDIHLYGEGFQKTFWPNYHDVYIAMRNVPAILRTLQKLHREAVKECEDNIEISEDDFAFHARAELAACFTQIEFNQRGSGGS